MAISAPPFERSRSTELPAIMADAENAQAEQRLAREHPERGGPELVLHGEGLEDQRRQRHHEAAGQHQRGEPEAEALALRPAADRNQQHAEHDQRAAGELRSGERLAQHQIGERIAEQRRALEEWRHHRRFVTLQRAKIKGERAHVEHARQRHQPDAEPVALKHIGIEPGDDGHQHKAHQRGEYQQHHDVGVFEVALDQILVQVGRDRPQDRAAQCEDEPGHGRVLGMARGWRPVFGVQPRQEGSALPLSLWGRGPG